MKGSLSGRCALAQAHSRLFAPCYQGEAAREIAAAPAGDRVEVERDIS